MANSTEPFEPTVNGALKALEAREDDIRATHTAAADEWAAYVVDTFWNGAVAIALVPPEGIRVDTLVVHYHPWHSAPGMVAVLAQERPDTLGITYTAGGDLTDDNVPVTNLP